MKFEYEFYGDWYPAIDAMLAVMETIAWVAFMLYWFF